MIRLGLIWSGIILLVMIAASCLAWGLIPSGTSVPIHWSVTGEVTRHTSKSFALVALPLIAVAQTLFLVFLPSIGGQGDVIEQSSGAYLSGWIGGISVLAFVHLSILSIAIGSSGPSFPVILICACVVTGILGNYIAKTRPNALVGLRTPHTLKSPHAWSLGNRSVGWGLVITAIGSLIVLAGVDAKMGFQVFLIGQILTLILGVTIAARAARSDPD